MLRFFAGRNKKEFESLHFRLRSEEIMSQTQPKQPIGKENLSTLKIALAVVAVVFVVGFFLFIILYFYLKPAPLKVTAIPYGYPYNTPSCANTDPKQCIPKDFSVWAFTTNGGIAIELVPDGTLTLKARTWNVNPAQRWTCGLQRAGLEFGRGIYVIQSLQDSSRAWCVDAQGNPGTCPINVGNPAQRFAMIVLSTNAVSTQSIYALVNQANQLALATDPTSTQLIYKPLDPNDQFQFWKAELVPLFGTL